MVDFDSNSVLVLPLYFNYLVINLSMDITKVAYLHYRTNKLLSLCSTLVDSGLTNQRLLKMETQPTSSRVEESESS